MSEHPCTSSPDRPSETVGKLSKSKRSARSRQPDGKTESAAHAETASASEGPTTRLSRDDPLRGSADAIPGMNARSRGSAGPPNLVSQWLNSSGGCTEVGIPPNLTLPQPPSGTPVSHRGRSDQSASSSILVTNGCSGLTGPKGANITQRPSRAERLDGAALEAAVRFPPEAGGRTLSVSAHPSPTYSISTPRCGSGHRRRFDTSVTSHSSVSSGNGYGPMPAFPGHRTSLRVHLSRRALIGKGSFGVVYKAMDTDTNQLLAVKEIALGGFPVPAGPASPLGATTPSSQSAANEKRVAAVQKELAVLRQLNHPNIVQCLGEEFENDCLRIYMEYVPGGSVSALLRTFGVFQERQASAFTRQILLGLSYLHTKNIIHRDLKGDNLLIDTHGTLKLADFGTARDLSNAAATTNAALAGTAYFAAPEMVHGNGVDAKADIWSTACCVIEMITGAPPLSHIGNQYSIMMLLAQSDGNLLEQYIPKENTWSAPLLDFLHQCLQKNPADRPCAQELLKHPWILHPTTENSVKSAQEDVLAVTVTSVALPEPIAPPPVRSSQDSILDMGDLGLPSPSALCSPEEMRTISIDRKQDVAKLTKKDKKRKKSVKIDAEKEREKERKRRAKSLGASPQTPSTGAVDSLASSGRRSTAKVTSSRDLLDSPFAHTTSQLQLNRDTMHSKNSETDTMSAGFLPPLSPGSHLPILPDLDLSREGSRAAGESASPSGGASGRRSPSKERNARRESKAARKRGS